MGLVFLFAPVNDRLCEYESMVNVGAINDRPARKCCEFALIFGKYDRLYRAGGY